MSQPLEEQRLGSGISPITYAVDRQLELIRITVVLLEVRFFRQRNASVLLVTVLPKLIFSFS